MYLNYPKESHNLPGKLIVIDGIGGSGKDTQAQELAGRTRKLERRTHVINLPRYTANPHGRLIKALNANELGDVSEMSPYLASYPYAIDRQELKPDVAKYLADGDVVILVRSFLTNLVYQGSKLEGDEQVAFCRWLISLEFDHFGIHRENVGILLCADPNICRQQAANRPQQEGVVGQGLDGYEIDPSKLSKIDSFYCQVVAQLPHWKLINCLEGEEMRTISSIADEVFSFVQEA